MVMLFVFVSGSSGSNRAYTSSSLDALMRIVVRIVTIAAVTRGTVRGGVLVMVEESEDTTMFLSLMAVSLIPMFLDLMLGKLGSSNRTSARNPAIPLVVVVSVGLMVRPRDKGTPSAIIVPPGCTNRCAGETRCSAWLISGVMMFLDLVRC